MDEVVLIPFLSDNRLGLDGCQNRDIALTHILLSWMVPNN